MLIYINKQSLKPQMSAVCIIIIYLHTYVFKSNIHAYKYIAHMHTYIHMDVERCVYVNSNVCVCVVCRKRVAVGCLLLTAFWAPFLQTV